MVEGKSQLAQAAPLTYTGERKKALVYFTALQTYKQLISLKKFVEIALQNKFLGIGSHTVYARLKL